MRVKAQNIRGRDREIDALIGTMVGAGVWTPAQGSAKRRQFENERREDDRYVRTGKRPRRR